MIEKTYSIETNSKIDASVIIPCKEEVTTLKSTVDSIMSAKSNLNIEIIIVDDGSTDKSTDFISDDLYKELYKDIILLKTDGLGCASAKNYGACFAKGKYLFFFDAHISIFDYCLDNLIKTLNISYSHIVAPGVANMLTPDSVGYGLTCDSQLNAIWISEIPTGVKEVPFVSACAFCIRKEVFDKIYGFDSFFKVYGSEDFEICLKAWLYGYKVVVDPEVKIMHLFKTSHAYKIPTENLIFNLLCLAYSHLNKDRIAKIISLLKSNSLFSKSLVDFNKYEILILKQREKYLSERTYNDDYYFEKFNIPFN